MNNTIEHIIRTHNLLPHPEGGFYKETYRSDYATGIFYLVLGIFAATVTSLFSAFPKEMIIGIAGIALFGTISSCLQRALIEPERESSFLTFAVAASGLSLFGIGSAFWAILMGIATQIILVTPIRKINSK